MRLTVGPLPPAVYWRRRVLALGAALLVIFLIAQACMASASTGDRADAGTTPDPTSSTSSPQSTTAPPPLPPATTSPTAEPDRDGGEEPEEEPVDLGPEGCTDDEIQITAISSETTFSVGQQVQFTIRIEHAGDRACKRDVGGDYRELYLVRETGAGAVWSSQSCADPSGSEVVELAEDWAPRAHNIGFAGKDCNDPSRDLEPGTYHLFARLGSAQSEPVTITLTDPV